MLGVFAAFAPVFIPLPERKPGGPSGQNDGSSSEDGHFDPHSLLGVHRQEGQDQHDRSEDHHVAGEAAESPLHFIRHRR